MARDFPVQCRLPACKRMTVNDLGYCVEHILMRDSLVMSVGPTYSPRLDHDNPTPNDSDRKGEGSVPFGVSVYGNRT